MAFLLPVAVVMRPLTGRRVAILGGSQAGKSTLLRFLRSRVISDDVEVTAEPAISGTFTIDVASKPVRFNVAKDVGGVGGLGYPAWKRQFFAADQVWYLFRSDLIALGDETELKRVKEHLELLKVWMSTRNGSKTKRMRPNVVLIGTWADSQPEYARDPTAFAARVGAAAPIKVGGVKLNNAALVVGGMLVQKNAERLVRDLAESLEDDL